MIKSLEESGMIERIPSKKDGRYKEIYLTKKAEAIRNSARSDKKKLEKTMTEGISADELSSWVEITIKMMNNLMEAGK